MKTPSKHASRKSAWIFLALMLAADAFLLWHAMLHGFDPQDYGGFLNVAWRISQGQRLYHDFYFHSLPLYVDTLALLFRILGFGKVAIYLLLAGTNILAAFFTFDMVRRRASAGLGLAAALMTLAGFNWFYAFPTYDTYVSLWGIAGLWILVTQLPFNRDHVALWISSLLGIIAAAAIFTKFNDGILYTAVFAGALILGAAPFRGQALSGFIAGLWAGLLAGCWRMGDLQTVHRNIFVYYTNNMGGRFSRFMHPSEFFTHGYWFPAALAVFFCLRTRTLRQLPLFLVLATTGTAIVSYITGSHRHIGHMPLQGVLVGLSFIALQKEGSQMRRDDKKAVTALLLIFVLIQTSICGYLGWEGLSGRRRHNLYGPCCSYTLQSEPLRGWKVYDIWGPSLDAIVKFVKENIPNDQSLLVLGDMHILYALTGHPAYRGTSFQFKYNDQPQPGPQRLDVRNNILKNPPEWLLTYKDNGPGRLNILLLYLDLEPFVLAQYRRVSVWGPYILLRRKADIA